MTNLTSKKTCNKLLKIILNLQRIVLIYTTYTKEGGGDLKKKVHRSSSYHVIYICLLSSHFLNRGGCVIKL